MPPRRSVRLNPAGKSLLVHFKPRSASQRTVLEAYPNSDVLFLIGPAGTGKTMAAVGCACLDLAAAADKKLLFLRPAVEAGRSLGHLPGTLEEKIDPFMAAFKQTLKKVALNLPVERICFEAVGFQRGMTYENCIVVVDEAQNLTRSQLVMLLTRLGSNAKIIFLGDPEQSDIKPTAADYDCDLDAVADALDGLERIAVIDFDANESLRNPLIAQMLKRLSR